MTAVRLTKKIYMTIKERDRVRDAIGHSAGVCARPKLNVIIIKMVDEAQKDV